MADSPEPSKRPYEGSAPVDQISRLDELYRSGQTHEALTYSSEHRNWPLSQTDRVRVLLLRGMALFDTGDAVASIRTLKSAVEQSRPLSSQVQFDAIFALFLRETDFQSPDETLPGLASLRQLATRIGDAYTLGALHLAVARIEGQRGHCVDAHRHLEVARRLTDRLSNDAVRCSVDLVDGSLELVAGNLARAKLRAESCLRRSEAAGLSRYRLGSLTNLATASLFSGNAAHARECFQAVLPQTEGLTYVRLGVIDSLVQVAVYEDQVDSCGDLLDQCTRLIASDHLPAPSWYGLYHQVTRCAYFERIEEWAQVVGICDKVDPEVCRRQYRAIRTALLCAKARALAHLGQASEAEQAIALAVRICPRGAVDPLLVLEASKAVCLSLRGELSAGAVHFDRALAGCRAIGHRYHEAWIARARAEIAAATRQTVTVDRPLRDLTDTALLLTDAATIIGAGHSIDLLAHRVLAILHATPLGRRVTVDSESGCEYQAEPTAAIDTGGDGTFRLRLRGSDRSVAIHVRGARSIDEMSLLKAVADLVQAAVNRTADTESEDEDQNLWPRTTVPHGGDAIFQSPRMTELLRIALRLAATDLPILITGETGTGKEILARLIHDASRAKRGPFVPFNAAATPRDLAESQLFGHRRGAFTGATEHFAGVIRSAEHGTLFLDEIGDLDLSVQPKLLRFLESGEVQPVGEVRPVRASARVIAATNADVDRQVHEGRLRPDLFYRIGAARLALPPLRDRKDEIPALASLFLSRYARECGRTGLRLGDDFIAALLLYDWPGNIRELANEVRRVVAMADDGATVSSTQLSPDILRRWNERPTVVAASDSPVVEIRLDQTLSRAVGELEQRFIDHALEAVGGRVSDAAHLLGLSRKGLFLKRRRRGLLGRRRSA
jgi:DNA-binding NtrC family response regulator/tetratricopeptide (TPR) repeat protein